MATTGDWLTQVGILLGLIAAVLLVLAWVLRRW